MLSLRGYRGERWLEKEERKEGKIKQRSLVFTEIGDREESAKH